MDNNVIKRIEVDGCYGFVGHYFFLVDEKFRVAVPSSFRKIITQETNQTLFLFPGPFSTIFVFTHSFWREVWDRLQKLYNPTGSPFNIQLMRLGPETWDVKMDSLGRILINEHLRKYIGINVGTEVAIMGFTTHFGIATRKVYDEIMGKFSLREVWRDLGLGLESTKEERDVSGGGEKPLLADPSE